MAEEESAKNISNAELATFISEHNAIYPSWWVDEISSDEATERSSEIINILFKGLLAEAKQALNLPENNKYT